MSRWADHVPTTRVPDQPDGIYMRIMFREFFFGPFETEEEVIEACRQLREKDPMWDYDPFIVHYGADPLPRCFVTGFRPVTQEMRKRIECGRKEVA